ncbi:MAG: DUF975 family protein [Treponema sp.]|nr:DUF975 family protein [Treponema sp.]
MLKENHEIRALARSRLRGAWLPAVGVVVIYAVILGASGVAVLGPFILGGPLALGLATYFLNSVRGQNAKIEDLFQGFKNFGSSCILFILQSLFVALWSLLLVIPGIVKTFSYSMSFYILRDNPEIGWQEAITRSRKMMDGHKGKLFCLYLSFIGWALLCVLSFGIGYLWLLPYMETSVAAFYEDLKNNQEGGNKFLT